VNAQRELGAAYATGDWSGPKDLVEAARWYRLAAEKGNARSQCDLGFMLLLDEGEPKNTEEGLMWIERAGELEDDSAYRTATRTDTMTFLWIPPRLRSAKPAGGV
jgi:TPR repeat protein